MRALRLVARVARYAASLACALVAAWCVLRGMKHLFGIGSSQVASLAGVGPALAYFVGAVLCLLAAGELFPRSEPLAPDAPR